MDATDTSADEALERRRKRLRSMLFGGWALGAVVSALAPHAQPAGLMVHLLATAIWIAALVAGVKWLRTKPF